MLDYRCWIIEVLDSGGSTLVRNTICFSFSCATQPQGSSCAAGNLIVDFVTLKLYSLREA